MRAGGERENNGGEEGAGEEWVGGSGREGGGEDPTARCTSQDGRLGN